MILLDTNIVSAVMAPSPPREVVAWLNAQESATLYLCTISLAEIGYGLRVLPDGKRRRLLEERFEAFVSKAFDQRILDFDQPAARIYGEVMVHRREIGRPLGIADGQIASIARSRYFAVATRNARDFAECGVDVINPFESTE